jgi:nucleotide-binding universal stress UspA family protein
LLIRREIPHFSRELGTKDQQIATVMRVRSLRFRQQMAEQTTAQPGPGCVVAAIDLSTSSRRVLMHAAGLARLFSTSVKVLHVGADVSPERRQVVLDFCALHGPYEVDLCDDDIVLRTGIVSDAIYREATRQQARLVVMGSRGHGKLAVFLLGSTTQAVLRNAPAPILLVPPVDLNIVDLADRVRLSCGPVLAAVDLADANDEQLRLAGELAHLAGEPLLLVTVTGKGRTDHLSSSMLRERAHRAAVLPRATIVRHGDIAEQISRCAVAERTGLVVMGLRGRTCKQSGAIATAVLRTNAAFVLAVPEVVS